MSRARAPLSPHRQAMLGLIGLVLLLGLAGVMLRAAGGAYADDYQLTALVTRPGFNLDETSTVKVRGVTVGGVGKIELLDDGTVELTLNMRKEVRIPESATARIEPLSVFGPKFVDIIPGEGEGSGPFLADGERIGETVSPSEVVETLETFSDVLASFDPEKLGTILTEMARGLDGLGEDLGATIDASDQLAEDFIANRGEVDALLANAVALGETLEDRGDQLVRITERGASVLDLLRENEDGLGSLLLAASQLSADLTTTIDAAGPDVAPLVAGLDRVTTVLLAQLEHLPTFTASNERIARFLGEDLIQWDIGDGRLGGVVRSIVVLDPCVIVPTTQGCPPPEQVSP
jgi:phospholipid/cholesterol/gamma-HCH transport system substrate-binding protein